MRAITIKGIPEEVYRRLKETAASNRRSLNSEAIVRIEKGLADERPDAASLLAELRRWQRRLRRAPRLTDSFLSKAKAEGRR
jgi:antitoxin FitA